ncbi:MAG: hypothetical protein AAF481_06785 [Acidobacteriota bacterium]
MSYDWSTVLHLFGGFLLFASLGGMVYHQLQAGETTGEGWGIKARKLAGATHGVALLVILFSGLMLIGHLSSLRVLQGFPWPAWVWLKLALWLVMGGILAVVRRAPRLALTLWWTIPLLGGLAAFLAIMKPGS